MFMEIYSEWRNEDVANLIPVLNGALANPKNIDPKALQAKLDHYLDDVYSVAGGILESNDCSKFQADNDPQALARVLEALEQTMLEVKRVVTFAQMADMHYADQSKELQEPILAMVPKLQGIAGFVNSTFINIISYVASMDDEKIQGMIAQSEELKKFETLINKCKKVPQPDLAKISALQSSGIIEAFGRLQQSAKSELSTDERKKLFSDGLSVVIKHKHDQAVAMGYPDTLAQFTFQNEAPHDLINNLVESSKKHISKFIDDFTEIKALAEDRLPDREIDGNTGKMILRYDWKTTQDIVCSAYAKLDPELGALARRAFDEGWVLAKEDGIQNPHTLGGLPASQSPAAHPFAAFNFDGSTMDVLMVGHEMAHVLSNYIAGQKQGVFTHDASLIVQESFSHFGEALVEDEMLRRASSPVEEARIKITFAAKEFDALTLISFTKLEEELYELMSKKDKGTASYEEINGLFRKHSGVMDKLFGEEMEIRDVPMLWSIINQPPHTVAVYPITKIMAAALHDEYEKDPEKFRNHYREIMEAGGNIGITKLWDKMIGKNVAEQKTFLDNRIADLADRVEALKSEMAALPIIPKAEKAEELAADKEDASLTGSEPAAFPAIANAQGAMAKNFAQSSKKANDTSKPWADRSTGNDSQSTEHLR